MDSTDLTATRGTNWLLSGLMLAAVGASTAAMSTVLSGTNWWLALMVVSLLTLLTAAVVRTFAAARLWGTLAAVIAAVLSMTVVFVPESAILGVIPTLDSVAAFRKLGGAGLASIAVQQIPATADQGIVYLVCLGVVALVVVMDALTFAARLPAFTGVPLAVPLLVPSLVRPQLGDAFFFSLTAAAYIAILLARSRSGGRRVAITIGASALVVALVTPIVAPDVEAGPDAVGVGTGFSTGVNPILTLGEDLRRGSPSAALTYTTSTNEGTYLRLTALDDFTGATWAPTKTDLSPQNTVAAIGAPPGLTDAVPRTEVTTKVTVENVQSRYLPAPYAPSSIEGLTGEWSWEPDALAIRSEGSTARGQVFEVQSTQISPSIDQLLAGDVTADAGLARYLALPDDLPEVVRSTAAVVVGGATTNYDKAIALQDFFRDGDFTYSEQTPVDEGYDGSGARVLGAFLQVKAGYCVHFASAMAAMARTQGIPSRVAVGFTPGTQSRESDGAIEYNVSTFDFHAWPELYFSGIGWVRFEPTPGRGVVPEFAPLAVDDPTTPDVDESVPVPEPITTPTTAPDQADDAPVADAVDDGASASATGWPLWWVLLVALGVLALVPALVRLVRRARRISLGTPSAAWTEIRDTADDLGLRTHDTRTPRQLADDLAPTLSKDARPALQRLRAALEGDVFAAQPATVSTSDVRAVLSGLRRRSTITARVLARLAPRSLVRRLLPGRLEVTPTR